MNGADEDGDSVEDTRGCLQRCLSRELKCVGEQRVPVSNPEQRKPSMKALRESAMHMEK